MSRRHFLSMQSAIGVGCAAVV
ncbi:twin-arginine translocation signal domain-containing protein [Microbulbifer taiwanensis]|uniref:Twin-arginine translocation signal domain-containing protein n=1 Tax=Microbulbifer taiwanensis TaxID=986746 RepID=A0ABW1YMR7_9GAMM